MLRVPASLWIKRARKAVAKKRATVASDASDASESSDNEANHPTHYCPDAYAAVLKNFKQMRTVCVHRCLHWAHLCTHGRPHPFV